MKESKCIAVVLAAGKGTRMGSNVPKQYIQLNDRPILYYSLEVFQKSEVIQEIYLVTGRDEIDFCRDNIVEKYKLSKVTHIIEGGAQRYNSVYNALENIKQCDYVFIHDGARPFIHEDMLKNLLEEVMRHKACVTGVRTKDTVKIADENDYISTTPNRNLIWNVQTPQVFECNLIKRAYQKLMDTSCENVTDDAMVVETMLEHKVKLVEGDYENIKITTPSDLIIAQAFLDGKKE